jgi:hypothetical protein
VVHWITASGGTVPFELPRDDNFGPERFTASLDAHQLSLEVVRNGRQESLISIDPPGWSPSERRSG